MSFDKPTRNALAKMVSAARKILQDDITKQLQSDFRLQPDGTALALDGLTEDQRIAAIELRDLLEHYATSEPGAEKARRAIAFDRLAREIGFTILNRLAALRLCEERGLVIECVRKGLASDGVRMFEMLAHGALGTRYQTYRVFIENLFDELAIDLGALFDRHSPLSRVFPSERTLEQVLALLNDPAHAHLWREDETIGWIYQYYNDEAERKQMRALSRAPRNSRELAVRNQFFTPRYVVEFLTDNTLGRIWYEMRGGNTRLAEDCRYLVIRPEEKGLATESAENTEKETKENPVPSVAKYVRPKKDPREILMLDPAGGSGHFGLYCFDLFETIYAEAYDDPDLAPKLRTDFPDRDDFLRQVPRLILEHNIHIIDIDPRACQIAALALWLRAQRSWQKMNLKPESRPRIRKVNVVCAEPMPGEKDLLDEFVAQLEPKELGQLVRFVFERMKLAGEAGSLLKIEEDLRDEIERLRKKAGPLFARGDFWDNAEQHVLDALQAYAEQATNGNTTRRRLFADDAAQGFAFIDLCRKKYDVVLMNPPFGELSKASKTYIEKEYAKTKGDILANFVERAIHWSLVSGLVGAISSRTCFYLGTLSSLREKVFQKDAFLTCMADLGDGVLEAMVETAIYVLQRQPLVNDYAVFIRGLVDKDKDKLVLSAIENIRTGKPDANTFLTNPSQFSRLPGSPYCYWVGRRTIELLSQHPVLEGNAGSVRVGLQTGEDWRFLRMIWEVPPSTIAVKREQTTTHSKRWVPFSKTDFASPWFSPILQLVDWKDDGYALKNFGDASQAKLKSRPQNLEYYFLAGFSYMLRSTRLVPYIVPAGVIPTAGRAQVYPATGQEYALLGFCASNIASSVARFSGEKFAWPKFQASMVQNIPVPTLPAELIKELNEQIQAEFNSRRAFAQEYEPFQEFTRPAWLNGTKENSSAWNLQSMLGEQLERKIANVFGLSPRQYSELIRDLQDAISIRGQSSSETEEDDEEDNAPSVELVDTGAYSNAEELIAYVLGCAFGRWDIRIALDPTLAPKLQDPFDPLPVCPPGMLVGTDGLPATPNNIVSEEWLRARPNAITLPDTAALQAKNVPLTTDRYPLQIAWDGILVDDAAHPSDIVRRVRDVLTVLWGDRAQAIEEEACQILGVNDLREYFSKPTGFFADHLKRYSKSRRQAPIYLPLSTASGRYTVWVYYHRLNQDTLYHIVNQYVEPKIESVDKRVDQLTEKLRDAAGRGTTDLREQLNDAKAFLSELREFRAELLRVAQLPYKPDLNDGVIITVAPLHKLFRLRKWANDTAAVWKKLEAGEYDWSHLAYNIWTGRVKKKCETDRSIAIAHGLEHLCKVAPKKAGKRNRKKQEEEDEEGE